MTSPWTIRGSLAALCELGSLAAFSVLFGNARRSMLIREKNSELPLVCFVFLAALKPRMQMIYKQSFSMKQYAAWLALNHQVFKAGSSAAHCRLQC